MHAHRRPERTSSAGPRRAAGPEAGAAGRVPARPPSAAVLHGLQRSVGNAAVARMLAGGGLPAAAVQRSAVHEVLRGAGRPLDERTRADMEGRLGADFSDVRVHTGPAAKASAAGIGARAYTSGNHVVIGEGGADRRTLAHELTHVIQQRSGPVAGTDDGSGLRISDPADRFEREAEANAVRALAAPAGRAAGEEREASGHGGVRAGALQRAAVEVAGEDRRTQVEQAVQEAQAVIEEAISLLYELRELDDPLGARVFVRYFGEHDDVGVLDRIERVYEGASDILDTIVIDDHQPNMMVGNEEGVHAYTVQGGPISVAGRFWSGSQRQRALTLVHEATHAVHDTHDDSGFGRAAAEAFARSSPDEAVDCAYNYEYFADDAGTASLGPGSDSESASDSDSDSDSD
ncbi:DUF4157 domain-containing protein [Kitasatospora sp. NPDC085464]|uniref:eCIS core domain-containing protein n=1 Tax=Kitasatospora sp. NPDC085464 TaxID=3364063 RepID=UPI0037C7FE9C